MTNELFLFIILVLILLYFLPERKHSLVARIKKRRHISNISNETNQSEENNEESPNETDETNESEEISNQNDNQYSENKLTQGSYKKKGSKNKTNKKITMELINDYLSEAKCEEGFEMMGSSDPYKNSQGNDMAFYPQTILPSNKLDKALAKSLVPDFEPSALNINADLNSFGYATNNPNDDNYYMNRGFINPTDGYQYANSVQYNLAHPYQTRYCDK